MRRTLSLVLAFCLLCCCITTALAADAPKDQRKHTKIGKYLTAMEAYEMWKAAPGSVLIVDVRTPEEYDFLGHPAMASNIPVQLWAGVFNAEKKAFPLAANPRFVDDVKRRFKPGDTLILMCRSGHRSAAASNLLTEAGFTNTYNIVDGYEGDKEADKASPNYGKRLHEGWRNSKAPWTTDLDEKLVYLPGK